MERKAFTARSELEQMLVDETAEPKALPLSLLADITNNFSNDRVIGRGGFAVVYKGILGSRSVVVKKFDVYMHEKEFHQQVQCLMRVKHKNVVRFLGYCADVEEHMIRYNGKFVMAEVHQRLLCFEYMPKGSLDKYITDADLEWRTCYKIIKGISEGLQFHHENHIIHLDLKPSNILLDDSMVPKITDFGLLRCFDENRRQGITKTALGTMGYLAPELLEGGAITYSADLYSLGVIIIEILTGQKGYQATEEVLESWSDRMERSQRDTLSEQIRVCYEIALECRDFSPKKRPASARYIIESLREMEGIQTGTCKFGPTCKFHHPREKAGIAGMVQLNALGYPLRPNERECAYYLKTGQCKYGNTCKFNHPEIFNAVASSRGSPIYPPVHTSGSTGPHSYTGTMASWTYPRGSFIPSPRWQSPSNYTPMIVPQGLVQVPNWNSYPGQMVPVSSPESRLQSPGAQQYYGTSRQGEGSAGNQGMQSPYRSSSFPVPQYALQRENVFPERPDQPECIYYIKTGDCKFGAVCKFHHPRVRSQPPPDCILSPMGLPLRPGEELCKFYSRYGICKFGVNCKFDHPMAAPMGVYAYGYSASASPNAPMARRLLESPSGSAYAS